MADREKQLAGPDKSTGSLLPRSIVRSETARVHPSTWQLGTEQRLLIVATFALLLVGAVMVYSVTSTQLRLIGDPPATYLVRFTIFAASGLLLMSWLGRVDFDWVSRAAVPLLLVSFVLVALTLVPGIGVTVNEASGWIELGVFEIQPAEVLKLALVLYVAQLLAHRPDRLRTLSALAKPVLLVVGAACVLLLAQPDPGSALVVCLSVGVLLLAAGARVAQLGMISGTLAGVALLVALVQPERRERLTSFLDPWGDAGDTGFQAVQAMIALGSGGIFGRGLGESVQKYFYLPEAHTEMILAITGEELGVFGVSLVATLFGLIAYAGLRTARLAADPYQKLLAVGITSLLLCQAVLNFFAVLGMSPLTGVRLPFVSYAGPNLIVVLGTAGLLLNVSRQVSNNRPTGHHPESSVRTLGNQRRRHIHLIDRRLGLVFAVFALLLTVGEIRALWLGAAKAHSLRERAEVQQTLDEPVPARRGTIFDRNGFRLAVSEPAFDVVAGPNHIEAPLQLASRLAPLLNRTESALLRDLTRRDKEFVYLARLVPANKLRAIKDARPPGLLFSPTRRREYPRERLAAEVLGAVDTDGHGLTGLEYTQESVLHGDDGARRIIRDALGVPISVRETEPVRSGDDIELTLDAGLQSNVEYILAGVGAKYRAREATAVVMKADTSEVVAMASWRRTDARAGSRARPSDPENLALSTAHEPGETFNLFTVAAALEAHKVTASERFRIPPALRVGEFSIADSYDIPQSGALTPAEFLKLRSNVGTVLIGLRLGRNGIDHWIRRFGFGRPTEIELPGESGGAVPELSTYSSSSTAMLAVGRGQAVTPLQLAVAYASIANGGVLRTPQIVSRIGGRQPRPQAEQRIISESTAQQILAMLGEHGTGSTRPIVNRGTGVYSETRVVESFASFFPQERPRFVVVVRVTEPRRGNDQRNVAASAFREIAKFAGGYLGIARHYQ